MKRLLVLEDGSVFEGIGFGGNDYQIGELIFQTGMTGYQEILSDLSYYGQIVMMTYPAIGNCGINRDDNESLIPNIFGFVVKEYCEEPSNFRCDMTLDTFLKIKNIPGIADIDTREITRKLRMHGVMKAVMAEVDADIDAIVQQLKTAELPKDGVQKVSTQKPFPIPSRGRKAVMVDIGTKFAVIREFNERDIDLLVVPYNMSAEKILELQPDGVILSGGPGHPEEIPETIAAAKALLGKVPLMGIGLGHEVLALACGGNIKKMYIGHHGNSIPVRNLNKQKIEFTAQNHGYELDEDTLQGTGIVITYRSLNDDSVEGFTHESYPMISVAFEPEAAPGADDMNYIFDDFIALMKERG